MMKKRCLCLVFAALLLLLQVSLAETQMITLKARDVVLSRSAGTLGIRPEDSNTYHLIDSSGQRISDGEYISIYAVSDYPYFKVEADGTDGIHNDGLIDAQGNILIPAEYADIEVWSDRWAGGATMRFISSKYAEYNSLAIAFDLGLNYFDEDNDFSLGITMRNVGAQLKKFDEKSEHLPFDLDVGITKSMAHAPVRFSLTMIDLTRWSSDYYYTEDGKKPSTGRILLNHFAAGVDIIPTEVFYISAGYNARRAYELKAAGSSHMAGFSIGGGLKLKKFKLGATYARYHVAASSVLVNLAYSL